MNKEKEDEKRFYLVTKANFLALIYDRNDEDATIHLTCDKKYMQILLDALNDSKELS